MKSKEEIEQLSFLEYPRLINDPYNPMVDDNADERKIWINAYSQCQEDMQKDVEYWQGEFDHWHQQAMEMARKKYTEEDMHKLWNTLMVAMTHHNPIFFKDYINSLNKQD
jgi:hypothetical protein